MKITKKAVEAREPGTFLWDGRFGVKVTGTRIARLHRAVPRGPCACGATRSANTARPGRPIWPARKRRASLTLVDSGVDPVTTKRTARAAPTVRELAERFMKGRIKAKRKTSTAKLSMAACSTT